MPSLDEINNKVIGGITTGVTSKGFINGIGWLFIGILIIGAAGAFLWWYTDKKKYNLKVTAFNIVGNTYQPNFRDVARKVKLGKGGFEVLYLKKLKTWKLAYGQTIGNTYYFFIDPIGYWYNGMLSADINSIDSRGGLIPIVVTNPNMRAQYTALEKQIDALHGEKQGFWDKYGSWVITFTFVVIVGVFSWLSYREIGSFLGQGTQLAHEMTALADTMNKLAVNLNGAQPSGLVPAP